MHKLQNALKGSLFFGHIHIFFITTFESFRKLIAAKLYPCSVDPGNYLGRVVELNGLLHLSQIGQGLYFFTFNLLLCHKVKIHLRKKISEMLEKGNILG